MDKYEKWQEARLEKVEDAIITLNKELGVVQGELRWIRILMSATVVGVFAQVALSILGL